MRLHILVLMAATLVACTRTSDRPVDSAAPGASAMTDTGMSAHSMSSQAAGSGAMMEQMRGQMQAMRAMNGDAMQAQMPMHRQMVESMMAQMTRDMTGMKVAADPRWSALMDSVRQDLARMPGMNGAALEKMMPAHDGRVTRMMEMHQKMMAPAK